MKKKKDFWLQTKRQVTNPSLMNGTKISECGNHLTTNGLLMKLEIST